MKSPEKTVNAIACAVCGRICVWSSRRWGFFCDRCNHYTEADVVGGKMATQSSPGRRLCVFRGCQLGRWLPGAKLIHEAPRRVLGHLASMSEAAFSFWCLLGAFALAGAVAAVVVLLGGRT